MSQLPAAFRGANRALKTGGASLAALAAALIAAPACAESSAAPDAGELLGKAGLVTTVQREAQASYWQAGDIRTAVHNQRIEVVAPQPNILIADPGTPTTARDPVNVNGIGQMIVDYGIYGISLCTGTLINPRTVLFAAHCVNSAAPSNYGANSGGQAIAWGFENNTLANAPGEENELLTWLGYAPGSAGKYQSNVAKAFYNSNYVNYNPLSLEPAAQSFLYGDVATSSLDTPAANVPTWALLFSHLPAAPITADGTGYHVTISGYGGNGTDTNGALPIDFRRRVAENTLGALASIDEFEASLFYSSSGNLPQNLYWTDFDDPLRFTDAASPFDFNALRDNALPNEGATAGGDSGGPLILDRTFAKSVLLGVLSGGYPGFFEGQPENSYGTVSFYQPLYLFWDWIAANNFYHYVGAKAGDGNWTDPGHWVTNLDPAYQVIVNGQLVNRIPGEPGAGNTDQPGFGQACFQDSTGSECYDVATGEIIYGDNPIGTEDAPPPERNSAIRGAKSASAVAALRYPTLANGLPGETGFVPDNFDGDRLAQLKPNYFDVTLGAAGKTTLNSIVVIDRFTIANAAATLDIQAGGSLTSLMSITQGTGTMQVNGALTSPGDYFMLTGGLNGTGVITTPFFTSMAGTISPGVTGNAGTIGALTFRGNTIFASGTTYMVDLGVPGASDQIVVVAGPTGGGIANVGGKLAISFASGVRPVDGSTYRILTAENEVTGAFATPTISAVIRPELTYLADAVDLKLSIGSYANVVDPALAVQRSYAALLDGNRAGSYSDLAGLYDTLDLQDVAGVRSFMEAATPRTETLRTATARAATETADRFFRQRLNAIRPGEASGELAVNGNPLPLASRSSFARNFAPLEGSLSLADVGTSAGKLADDASGYLTAGYIDGSSQAMPTAVSLGRDQFDGWFAAFGLEKAVSVQATIGFGLSYSDLNGTTGGAAQQAGAQLVQGHVYGALAAGKGLMLDLRVSAGLLSSDSQRSVTLVSTPYALNLQQDSLAFAAEAGIGYDVIKGGKISFVPRASLRYASIGFDRAAEVGGPMALAVERQAYKALESRFGASVAGTVGKVRAHLEASFVRDLMDQKTGFDAGFVGGTALAPFALAGTDDNWAEVSGGLSFDLGRKAVFAVEADSTVFRSDLRNQTYRGSLTLRF